VPLVRKLGHLATLQANQWRSRVAIEQRQLRLLKDMVRFCEARVPLYRRRFRAAGVSAADLRTLADLRHFPILTREELVEAYPDEALSRPPRASDVVFRTSGSSGLFMEIAYSAEANDWLDAAYARALFATGYRPWHSMAYFWWEEERAEKAYERAGLMRKHLLPLDPDPRAQLAQLIRLQPRYIYNFPTVMMMIARIVEAERVDLRPEGIICHGELLAPPIRDEIARVFRCPVWNQYGAQEVNRVAWDCELHDALHVEADTVHVEAVDDEGDVLSPGVSGRLLVTGLRNRLMPLIRYAIGDEGMTVAGRCACGRGLPRIALTEGRADDILTLADGRRLGPRVLAPRVERLPGIRQYRLTQHAPDRFELTVVWEGAPAHDALRRSLTELLGDDARLEIRDVAEIPLSRRGKLRKIVSAV